MSSYRYRSGNDSDFEFWKNLILLVLGGIFLIWFYSVKVEGTGTVAGKWPETSCSEDSCSTTYIVQFDDGKIFSVLFKPHWDAMMPGQRYNYYARGRHISFFGWRLYQPTIFKIDRVISPP